MEEAGEIRLREAVRRARADTEEEFREKVRLAERRGTEEVDQVRLEMAALKRRMEESARELENAKRKVNLSRTDGKLEAQAEVDEVRSALRDAEEKEMKLAQELRRSREENAALQGKLAGALQAAQVCSEGSCSIYH